MSLMNIRMERQNQAFHFQATNETGAHLQLDGSAGIGGENKGFSPMQSLLAAIGACSAIDIGLILQKQKQVIEDFAMDIQGERTPVADANIFTAIHIQYGFTGDLDAKKVRRAIDLSLEKYCSVAKMLEKTASITYSFTVNEEIFE
ncbi:MAG: OsmC family protein [Bacteroidota bacterium]